MPRRFYVYWYLGLVPAILLGDAIGSIIRGYLAP
jgi:hypothetical protein